MGAREEKAAHVYFFLASTVLSTCAQRETHTYTVTERASVWASLLANFCWQTPVPEVRSRCRERTAGDASEPRHRMANCRRACAPETHSTRPHPRASSTVSSVAQGRGHEHVSPVRHVRTVRRVQNTLRKLQRRCVCVCIQRTHSMPSCSPAPDLAEHAWICQSRSRMLCRCRASEI